MTCSGTGRASVAARLDFGSSIQVTRTASGPALVEGGPRWHRPSSLRLTRGNSTEKGNPMTKRIDVPDRHSRLADALVQYRKVLVALVYVALTALPFAAEAALNVPKAKCGSNDRPETGLQGQTSNAERASGAAEKAFKCNLDLVSQFQGEGASYGFAWHDHCGYYGTANGPKQAHPGVVVVDAQDRKNVQATAYLNSRAFLEPWESLKVHEGRKLLGGTKGLGRSVDDKYYAFYDVTDCAHPVLLSDIEVAGSIGHAGNFTPDGMTYFGTYTLGPGVTVLDITDPK